MPLGAVPARGADARFKRKGGADLYLVPLAEALSDEMPAGGVSHPLTMTVDPDTVYRVLIEALFTCGEVGFREVELVENTPARRSIVVDTPRPPDAGARPAEQVFRLLAIVIDEGVGLKTPGGNIAPGCVNLGAGLAFPGAPGAVDLPALSRCAARIRAEVAAPHGGTTVVASPAIAFREVLDVALALQQKDGASASHVTIGDAR